MMMGPMPAMPMTTVTAMPMITVTTAAMAYLMIAARTVGTVVPRMTVDIRRRTAARWLLNCRSGHTQVLSGSKNYPEAVESLSGSSTVRRP